MATCRAIIKRAMQKLALIAPGQDPEASEAETGMSVLQGMFDGWASNGMFGRVDDFITGILSSDVLEYTLPEPGAPLELPIRIQNSDGESVTPRDLSYTEYVDEDTSERRAYLFDARRAAWVRIDNLTLDSECPLSRRSTEGLAAFLGVSMCEEFGREPGPVMLRQAGSFNLGLSAGYGEERTEGTADYF